MLLEWKLRPFYTFFFIQCLLVFIQWRYNTVIMNVFSFKNVKFWAKLLFKAVPKQISPSPPRVNNAQISDTFNDSFLNVKAWHIQAWLLKWLGIEQFTFFSTKEIKSWFINDCFHRMKIFCLFLRSPVRTFGSKRPITVISCNIFCRYWKIEKTIWLHRFLNKKNICQFYAFANKNEFRNVSGSILENLNRKC